MVQAYAVLHEVMCAKDDLSQVLYEPRASNKQSVQEYRTQNPVSQSMAKRPSCEYMYKHTEWKFYYISLHFKQVMILLDNFLLDTFCDAILFSILHC